MDTLSSYDIISFNRDGDMVVFQRLGITMSNSDWNEFMLSDELTSDPEWQSGDTLNNYLAAERQAPLFMALRENVSDAFAGEEFSDEF